MSASAGDCSRPQWQVPRYDRTMLRERATKHCIVIPVINEGARIRSLLSRMHALGIAALADIVIVDGGSTDGSLEHAWLERHGVRALLVKRAPGKLGAQLRCAYAFAFDEGYDGIVTIDGNDKDDPDAIPAFVAALDRGIDFVQASRFIAGGVSENAPPSRLAAIRLLHAPVLSIASGFRWTDTTQGFRAYSRRLVADPRLCLFRDVFQAYELLAYVSAYAPRLGFSCLELPTARRYPPGEVPTKIVGFGANLALIGVLFKAATGAYRPR